MVHRNLQQWWDEIPVLGDADLLDGDEIDQDDFDELAELDPDDMDDDDDDD